MVLLEMLPSGRAPHVAALFLNPLQLPHRGDGLRPRRLWLPAFGHQVLHFALQVFGEFDFHLGLYASPQENRAQAQD